MKIESLEEKLINKMNKIISEPVKRIDSFSGLEPKLMKHIVDIEDRLVKLRQEINPYELLKKKRETKATAERCLKKIHLNIFLNSLNIVLNCFR